MLSSTTALPDNIEQLKSIIDEKERQYTSQIKLLEEQIRYLKGKLFGRKSEKLKAEDPNIRI